MPVAVRRGQGFAWILVPVCGSGARAPEYGWRRSHPALLRGTLRRFIQQRYDRKPIVLSLVLEA